MQSTVQAIVAYGARDLRVEAVSPQPCAESQVVVDIAVGGICGSDLHYFNDGAVGDFALREPLILGHEIVGRVRDVGAAVTEVPPGLRVAIDPRVPCGVCATCSVGRQNLCRRGTFLGSAATMPHSQGGFRDRLVVEASQCVPLPDALSFADAAFAEPLAVAIHAVGRAGPVFNRRVLITGAGPIGLLTLVAAIHAGAAEVAITDVVAAPLEAARELGAAKAIDVSGGATVPVADIAIEASGSPSALADCMRAIRPGGRLVLLGLLPRGDCPLPVNLAVAGELDLVGSFRFGGEEFCAAVAMLSRGLDLSALLSARIASDEAQRAFELASQREQALKVQVVFSLDA